MIASYGSVIIGLAIAAGLLWPGLGGLGLGSAGFPATAPSG
jgi:hypothetical protein